MFYLTKKIHCYQVSIILLVVLFCYCQVALAQSETIPAQIIKVSGDTVEGYINFYDTDKNPDKIEFKVSSDAKIQTYQPSEVESFYLPSKGIRYLAKNI